MNIPSVRQRFLVLLMSLSFGVAGAVSFAAVAEPALQKGMTVETGAVDPHSGDPLESGADSLSEAGESIVVLSPLDMSLFADPYDWTWRLPGEAYPLLEEGHEPAPDANLDALEEAIDWYIADAEEGIYQLTGFDWEYNNENDWLWSDLPPATSQYGIVSRGTETVPVAYDTQAAAQYEPAPEQERIVYVGREQTGPDPQQVYDEGFQDGYGTGYEKGFDSGYDEGQQQTPTVVERVVYPPPAYWYDYWWYDDRWDPYWRIGYYDSDWFFSFGYSSGRYYPYRPYRPYYSYYWYPPYYYHVGCPPYWGYPYAYRPYWGWGFGWYGSFFHISYVDYHHHHKHKHHDGHDGKHHNDRYRDDRYRDDRYRDDRYGDDRYRDDHRDGDRRPDDRGSRHPITENRKVVPFGGADDRTRAEGGELTRSVRTRTALERGQDATRPAIVTKQETTLRSSGGTVPSRADADAGARTRVTPDRSSRGGTEITTAPGRSDSVTRSAPSRGDRGEGYGIVSVREKESAGPEAPDRSSPRVDAPSRGAADRGGAETERPVVIVPSRDGTPSTDRNREVTVRPSGESSERTASPGYTRRVPDSSGSSTGRAPGVVEQESRGYTRRVPETSGSSTGRSPVTVQPEPRGDTQRAPAPSSPSTGRAPVVVERETRTYTRRAPEVSSPPAPRSAPSTDSSPSTRSAPAPRSAPSYEAPRVETRPPQRVEPARPPVQRESYSPPAPPSRSSSGSSSSRVERSSPSAPSRGTSTYSAPSAPSAPSQSYSAPSGGMSRGSSGMSSSRGVGGGGSSAPSSRGGGGGSGGGRGGR